MDESPTPLESTGRGSHVSSSGSRGGPRSPVSGQGKRDLQDPQISSMNSSSYSYNVSSSLSYRDASSTAVVKNVIVVALGLIINYINGTLIHTFRKNQIFYVNPRYILFIHLVLNDIIQLTTTISLFVLSYAFYRFNASVCCLIITLAIFTTLNTPLNLAVMAVECYIAICLPLRHAELCTIKRTYILIGWIWAMSAASTLPDVFILLATEPLRLFYSTIFCERDNLFHHPISLDKRDVSYIIFLIGVWLTLFYTYFKIFFTAKAAKEAKSSGGDAKKARNTILLHGFQLILCMLTFVAHVLKKALLYWFPKYYAHALFACYIIIQMLPRFISPIVYGLRDKTFRHHLKKYLLCSIGPELPYWFLYAHATPLTPEVKTYLLYKKSKGESRCSSIN
ncbi:odorant receptor 131-2-like [Scomber scombrus]|uniref:odorant receptor 131-2-like n=1 Tax=Scomber scombrus TaxID=13677 RepID=UPI002DDB01F9|nr:odorant receptor 131-2-like [Scomber scombrus]